MKVSAKIEYACRALLELALHWPNAAPLQVSEIAKKQKVPTKFLVQILIQLRQLGLVESVRGKRGGYRLGRPPQEITLSYIFKNLGVFGYSIEEKKNKGSHVMDIIWQELDENILKVIDSITLETICNRDRSKDKIIMYEI